MKRRRPVILVLALVVPFAACTSATEEEISDADLDAIVSLLTEDVTQSGSPDVGVQTLGLPPVLSPVEPLASCTPKLAPPRACPSGGDVRTTMNLDCPDPPTCCGEQPKCAKWTTSIRGVSGTTFNSCKTAPHITVSGTLNAQVTGTVSGPCAGYPQTALTLSLTGSLSVRVNGREVCPGFASVRISANTYAQSVVFVSGTLCGRSISKLPTTSPCKNSCGSFCCPAGALCGRLTNHCLSPSFPVDCGEWACPKGTKCGANKNCTT